MLREAHDPLEEWLNELRLDPYFEVDGVEGKVRLSPAAPEPVPD